jgi:hypothetical protein
LPWGATSKTLDDIPLPLKNLCHEDAHESISDVADHTTEFNRTPLLFNPQKILQRNLGKILAHYISTYRKVIPHKADGTGWYINTYIACTATDGANVFQEFTFLKSYNLNNALKFSGIQWMSD